MRRARSRRGLRSLLGVALGAVLGAGAVLLGCGRQPGGVQGQAAAGPLTVYVPCVIATPMREVIAAYGALHPELEIAVETDKPLALLGKAAGPQPGPAAVITMGDVEMEWLASVGAVAEEDVQAIAANTYPLVVVAAADGAPGVREVADLVGSETKQIYVEDPAQSTLGARAERAFEQLGLWEGIQPKVIRPDPQVMVLAELVAGKGDATVLFRDCLFGESGEGASPPKTVRIIGEIPAEAYPPIFYQAATLRGAGGQQAARGLVSFLSSAEGQRALAASGLTPVREQ